MLLRMNKLCKYKDIFGKPNENLHSIRLFNIAIIDVIAMIISAYVLSYITKLNFLVSILILFVLSIILHRIFCVKTTIDKLLFVQ